MHRSSLCQQFINYQCDDKANYAPLTIADGNLNFKFLVDQEHREREALQGLQTVNDATNNPVLRCAEDVPLDKKQTVD